MGIKMDGKGLADNVCIQLKDRCNTLKDSGINPRLMIITSGDSAANQIYIRSKVKRCEEIGIDPVIKHYDKLDKALYTELYMDAKMPIIVQEPIVGEATPQIVAKTLNPNIDVDGASLINMGMLATGIEPHNAPCTPMGVMMLINQYQIPTNGKSALVIGRSNIVGRPMAMMLEQAGCTVTIAHSHTPELQLRHLIFDSDITVSAVGKRNLACMDAFIGVPVGQDKTIIDVGMNRDKDGKLCGDFSEKFKQGFGFYTPTPGGTGPMTVAVLMSNVIKYYERRK